MTNTVNKPWASEILNHAGFFVMVSESAGIIRHAASHDCIKWIPITPEFATFLFEIKFPEPEPKRWWQFWK